MKQLLNTLYVMTQGAYLHLDHETLKVEIEGKTALQVPLHHLGGVVTMGNVMVSPFLMGRCAEDGRSFVVLDRDGRFKCRMVGRTSGNVLLRRAQYEHVSDAARSLSVSMCVAAGKVRNCRAIVMRGARESGLEDEAKELRDAAQALSGVLLRLERAGAIDAVRGFEGEAASVYFGVFSLMVKEGDREAFRFRTRSRRPPLDRINALLSFLYTLVLGDCVSALEGAGLDPQMGFLHTLRPGRPSLGLDIMEEMRPVLADRLALTLINRKQISTGDFEERSGGAVYLSESGRKTVVVAYQKRKQDEVNHPLLNEGVPLGLVMHVQARILARHIRGEIDSYVPFMY
jgi:CRISPR-associated protein Cas1